jgi:hypothetical protein
VSSSNACRRCLRLAQYHFIDDDRLYLPRWTLDSTIFLVSLFLELVFFLPLVFLFPLLTGYFRIPIPPSTVAEGCWLILQLGWLTCFLFLCYNTTMFFVVKRFTKLPRGRPVILRPFFHSVPVDCLLEHMQDQEIEFCDPCVFLVRS